MLVWFTFFSLFFIYVFRYLKLLFMYIIDIMYVKYIYTVYIYETILHRFISTYNIIFSINLAGCKIYQFVIIILYLTISLLLTCSIFQIIQLSIKVIKTFSRLACPLSSTWVLKYYIVNYGSFPLFVLGSSEVFHNQTRITPF